ncbi:hypothetical protein ANN_11851 [Periplaneta americana]|uniref:Uncharacterized protein n=1 Tax=Periplaneta americana TaxID=6978 RepID=A0ABQ8T674_PERAM|nr:hypothetical protein ANN_11851 [Periplaneta americana]
MFSYIFKGASFCFDALLRSGVNRAGRSGKLHVADFMPHTKYCRLALLSFPRSFAIPSLSSNPIDSNYSSIWYPSVRKASFIFSDGTQVIRERFPRPAKYCIGHRVLDETSFVSDRLILNKTVSVFLELSTVPNSSPRPLMSVHALCPICALNNATMELSYPPYLEAVSSIRNLRTRHAVVIGTHNINIEIKITEVCFTDALLSGCPPAFLNVGLAATSLQNRKDGSRRVPSRDCRGSRKNFPPKCSDFLHGDTIQEIQPKCIPELINSFLVAFRGGSSRATATWLILDTRVPIFEMFHPSRKTAGAHAHISVCTLKSEVNFSSRFFFFNKEFNDSTLSKRTIVVDHFANIVCVHMMEVNDVTICRYIA